MKRVFLTIILFAISSTSFCQFQLGIKTGYNWFKILQSDNYYHPSSFSYDKSSIPISVFVCQRNHLVNLSFELEFLNRSYSVSEYWGGLGSGGLDLYSIDSYSLNAIIEPQFTFGRKVKFFVFPGLSIGIPLFSTINGTVKKYGSPQPIKIDTLKGSAKNYIPKIEFCAIVGIGVDIPLNKNLMITIQNIFSISLIPTKSKWASQSYRFIQNKLEVGLLYQFGNKRKIEKSSQKR